MSEHLEADDLLTCYVEEFGGTNEEAANQVRAGVDLEAIAASSRRYEYYLEADLALQAAALAYAVTKNHVFWDGNKRTSLIVLRTFLLLNGYEIDADQEERATWILALSVPGANEDTVHAVAYAIRQCLKPATE